jgi:sugar lactone lactonase YvrE
MTPRVLLDGLAIGESARWHDGRLWFANWGTGEIIAVDLDARREVRVRLPVETLPISFDWLPDGRLLVVAGTRLLRQEPDGSLVTHADLGGLSQGFNEIVVDGAGRAYVNGGDFDFATGGGSGIVVLVGPDGTSTTVAEDIAFGNGMAITPDGGTLIVAESWARRLSAFTITADGGLNDRRVWADCGTDLPDGAPPDGICVDAEGAVWYADVPNKRCVRVREGGAELGSVVVDRGAFSCMLGGPDGRTLFVLAAEWTGFAGMDPAARTGQLLVAGGAPAAHAGRP